EHNEMLLDVVVQSANNFGCFTNRGDEFDEEYAYQLAAGERHLIHIENGYYDELQMDDMNNDYESDKVKSKMTMQYMRTIKTHIYEFKKTAKVGGKRGDEFDEEYAYQLAAGERHLIHIENGYYDELQMDDMNNDYESDKRKHQARLQYKQQDVPEPVDFKNNGVLWLPPEPEDEEDEREALLFDGDDDDDVDAAGEWGYIRSSSNLRSEDYRSRDKPNEEHKKAM
ncbi:hypothetical protein Tco_0322700, partial [Tanacetum coccineum]